MKKYPWKRGLLTWPFSIPPVGDCKCDNCVWSQWVWNVLDERVARKELLDLATRLRKDALQP